METKIREKLEEIDNLIADINVEHITDTEIILCDMQQCVSEALALIDEMEKGETVSKGMQEILDEQFKHRRFSK